MFEHSSNMTRAQLEDSLVSLACTEEQRIKSPYTVMFLGLVRPSVFGMVGDHTMSGLTAQGTGPSHESDLRNG